MMKAKRLLAGFLSLAMILAYLPDTSSIAYANSLDDNGNSDNQDDTQDEEVIVETPEDGTWVLMNIPYSDYYTALTKTDDEDSSEMTVDAVTSATYSKSTSSTMYPGTYRSISADGVTIQGVTVLVYIPEDTTDEVETANTEGTNDNSNDDSNGNDNSNGNGNGDGEEEGEEEEPEEEDTTVIPAALTGLTRITSTSESSTTVEVTERGETTDKAFTYTGIDALFASDSYSYYILTSEEKDSYIDGGYFTIDDLEVADGEESETTISLTYNQTTKTTVISDEDLSVTTTTSSSYGDYQINMSSTTMTSGLGTVYGVVISTAEGDSYGLRHLENIWKSSKGTTQYQLALSFGIVTTEKHGNTLAYENYQSMIGQTITTITYYTSQGVYVIDATSLGEDADDAADDAVEDTEEEDNTTSGLYVPYKYILMNIPYAEFYAAELVDEDGESTNDVAVDAVSSATLNKTRTNTSTMSAGSYHVNSDGSDITGITYMVEVTDPTMLSSFTQVTDNTSVTVSVTNRGTTTETTYTGADALFENSSYAYYCLDAEGVASYLSTTGYKTLEEVTITTETVTPEADDEEEAETTTVTTYSASFSAVTGVSATSLNAIATITASTTYGDYQIDITDTTDTLTTSNIGAVYAVVLTTSEGNQYGLRQLENIWKVNQLAFSVGNTTTVHGCTVSYAHYASIVGQTITKITYYTDKGLFDIVLDGSTFDVVSTVESTDSTTGAVTKTVTTTTYTKNSLTVPAQYVLMNIPYAEFYAAMIGENNTVEVDAVSSATLNKTRTYTSTMAKGSYHVNSDGSDISGVIYVVEVTDMSLLSNFKRVTSSDSVSVSVTNRGSTTTYDLSGAEALFENEDHAYYFLSATEAASYIETSGYMTLTSVIATETEVEVETEEIETEETETEEVEGEVETTTEETPATTTTTTTVTTYSASFSAITGGTVTDLSDTATVEVSLSSKYGDYQIDITADELTTDNISAVYAVILETTDGTQYGLRHVENIWKVYELAFSVGFTTTVHGCTVSYEHYASIVDKTLSKITYYTAEGIYVINLTSDDAAEDEDDEDDDEDDSTSYSFSKSLAHATVTLEQTSYDYTGEAIEAAVTVTYGGTKLSADTDYTVTYSNNTNAGTATILITGAGDYAGSVSKTFTIVGTDLADCAVSLEADSYVYTGEALTPAVTITYTAEGDEVATALVENTDYTVAYTDNTNAGTATVTITGIGAYQGSITKTFTIEKASQSITAKAAASSITYGKTTTVSVSGVAEDAAVSYSSSKTSIATVNSSGKVTSKAAGSTTITVSVAETDNYKAASAKVSVTVTRASQKLTASAASTTLYKGSSGSNYTQITAKTTGNGTITYKVTSGSSYVSVDSTGKITVKKAASKAKTATITVTAGKTSQYNASNTVTIKITIKKFSTTTKIKTAKNSSSKKIKVTWTKKSGVTGYEIQYSTSKKFTSSTTKSVTVSGASKKSTTLSSLKKGTTYYIRIRTYKTVGGKTYSSWSTVKKVKVTK